MLSLLEIDPAAGLARVGTRGGAAEPVFEKRDFLVRVAANFAKLARPYVVRIPAARASEAVAVEVAAVVRERLGLHSLE